MASKLNGSAEETNPEPSFLDTGFPVLLPETPELHLAKPEFDAYIATLLPKPTAQLAVRSKLEDATASASTTAAPSISFNSEAENKESTSAFMDALLGDKAAVPTLDDRDDKMLTENADVAYSKSGDVLVDLFYELETVVHADQLHRLLENAWNADATMTLKLIWNARSIHLGKSSRHVFYRAVGWLAQNHPATLVANLPWLVRPVIPKKVPQENKKKDAGVDANTDTIESKDADSDFEMIDENGEEQPRTKRMKLDKDEFSEHDVKYGTAHGYWKDLLNILALAVNDELKFDGDSRSVLNVKNASPKKRTRDWTEGRKKDQTAERHERVVEKLENDGVYKALHLTVARLFADQLRLDVARLRSGSRADRKLITLAGKWAPSHKGMHDQHTGIVSTIAELLYPFEEVCPASVDRADRTLYLKYARAAYQSKTLSPLRRAIGVVEQPITEEKFSEIKYDRIPSLAMKQYTSLFIKKDFAHFEEYIENVAKGKIRISGATLLPSTLVKSVRSPWLNSCSTRGKGPKAMIESKKAEIERDLATQTADGQWKTLCQRIKDSGTLASSIAVCDVSGSMSSPRFADNTCPMDSAIGLSLLLAEVTEKPFGGAFITFSESPKIMRVGGSDDKRSLKEKVDYIERSNWSMNTDFVAVFRDLILPLAIKNKLKREDMVKQLFVFSDMQFDAARCNNDWSTSYERIKRDFDKAGYDMPKLIFWNLAGGRAGYFGSRSGGNVVAPKPVTAAEEGTALVSGYSQGQLKMFLENGLFNEPEEEEEVVEDTQGEDEDEVIVDKKVKKEKMDPTAMMKKAISHEAYSMLKVVD